MNFSLTEEQTAIQEMALNFAKERLAPDAVAWDEKGHFPIDVIKETAALGMATIYVPEDKGGSGLSRMDGALIMEALSYGCPSIAAYISIHNMVAWMVSKYATPAQNAAWMPKLASMEWLSSYCLTEPGSGSDAAAMATRAERVGDTYVLNGSKQFISGAGATDFYFVFARTGGAKDQASTRRRWAGIRSRLGRSLWRTSKSPSAIGWERKARASSSR
jgi:alkylation response protein AidB-like acyl-CoA dehydrogenase